MDAWQLSMAVGLSASTLLSAVLWLRARRRYFAQRSAFRWVAPPAIRFGWVAIVAPLVEVWILYMGGFWA